MDERRELTVKLARVGPLLTRAYHLRDFSIEGPSVEWSSLGADFRFGDSTGLDAIAMLLNRGKAPELIEHFSQGNLSKAGDVLFRALFGERESWEHVLRNLFDQPDGPAPTPIRAPVRVRVCTTDPVLSSMPWRATAWEGRRLVHERWTFEVTLEEKARADVRLPARCRVLVIAPQRADLDALGTDAHLAQLREALTRVSAHYADDGSIRITRTHAETKHALAHMEPEVVYYFGHGEVIEGITCLLLEGEQPMSMADLKQAMAVPARIVFVNGCMTGAGGWESAGHQLTPAVPLVVSNRTTAWTNHSGPAAIAWLEACLGGGPHGERDPVVLLDHLAASESTRGFQWTTTIVHTGHARWSAADVSRTPRRRIGTDLDRWPQRHEAFAHVSNLVQTRDRRVEAIVAYGGPGNLIPHAADQLISEVERIGARLARIKHVELRFPESRKTLTKNLGLQLRDALGIGPHDNLESALRKRAPLADSSGATPVLWLDWGTFGAGDQAPLLLDPDHIGMWIEFCAGELSRECPREIRIVSFLAMEIDPGAHTSLVEKFEQHQIDFGSAAFNADILPAFDRLRLVDLHKYLRDWREDLDITEKLAGQIADLVFAKTKGRYEETVALLEEGSATTWLSLRDKLKVSSP